MNNKFLKKEAPSRSGNFLFTSESVTEGHP